MDVSSGTAKAARIGLPQARGWRLGAALIASLVLHLAVLLPIVLQRPPLHAGDPGPAPLLARLVVPEAPAPATPAAHHGPGREVGVGRAHRRQAHEGAPARPASPKPPTAPPMDAGPASAQRVPYVALRVAHHEAPEDVQAEKLSAAQRRVPRAIELALPVEQAGPVHIAYPPGPLARGEKGHVLLEVFVSSAGRVDRVVVLEHAEHPDLAKAAVEGLRRARFRPAEGAEGKVRSRVTFRIDFSYE